MEVTDSGNSTEVNFEHPLNTSLSTVFINEGSEKLTVVKLVQPLNISLSIVVTEAGITIEDNTIQPLKTL
jgi:hypothetical protein